MINERKKLCWMFLLAIKYSLIYYDKKLYYENIAWTAFVNVNITLNLRSYKENQFYTSIHKKIYALLLLDLRQNFMTIFLILPKQLLINMLLLKKRKHSKHPTILISLLLKSADFTSPLFRQSPYMLLFHDPPPQP